jgi:Tetrapyrrole (Corrin/Porphyrin) Methylases
MPARGSLTVVGTGIRIGTQLTPEAAAAIERADVLLYITSDPVADSWVAGLNPNARSLQDHYRLGVGRRAIYAAMADDVVDEVRAGKDVCLALYGHPGVFVRPSHDALRRARDEGFEATMLPAVSAEDALFADLGVDPGASGCQSYEATDFLVHRRPFDPTAALILWQISMLGMLEYAPPDPSRRRVLADYLVSKYPRDHEAVLYEASPYPGIDGLAEPVRLDGLAEADVTPVMTLYVPPLERRAPDVEMLRLLGISEPAATGR